MIRFLKAKAVFGYLPLSVFVHTVDDMAKENYTLKYNATKYNAT